MNATTTAASVAPSPMAPPGPGSTATGLDAALDALEFSAVLEHLAERAAGPLAAEALRRRRPQHDPAWITGELAVVGEALALLRSGVAFDVVPVPDLRGPLARLRVDGSVLEVVELSQLLAAMSAGRAIMAQLAQLGPGYVALAARAVPPVDRAVERRLERAIGPDDELLDTASPALAAARREVHVARERVVGVLEGVLRGLDPAAVPGGASVTVRNGRYVIPVRRDARRRPDGILHDESGSAGTLFIEPGDAIGPGNALRSAVAAEERAVLAVLRELTTAVRPVAAEIEALHRAAVELDTVMARARWALEFDGEVPVIGAAGTGLVLRQARHPLLLARGVSVVPFDLVLDPAERTLLVTGPNTGGKTVLLKTIALVPALAQAGIVPPAAAGTELPLIERFFIDIGDHQSIAADLSTFSAHVGALRRILVEADAGSLVVLDEVGSGTDPAEGGALAMAVLEALTRRGALTLATTHLGALKSLASRVPGVVNGSLQFDAATLSPTFRFTKGVPGRSYGLAIARRLGVDATVLAEAEALVPQAERDLDRLLADVEARRAEMSIEEADQARRRAELADGEARIAAAAEELAARELVLRRDEKEASRQRARQAKAYLLEARKRVETALGMARGAADEAAAREARRLLEEGIRDESVRLEEVDRALPAGASSGELAVGSSVRLSTGAIGDVVELRADDKAVVQLGAMRLVVSRASLTAAPRRAAPAPPPRSADAPAVDAPAEVDLRGLRVDEAQSAVIAALDAAVLAERPRVAIIHGMGTGALRDAVRQILAADRRVASYEFAPRQQGGTGVTVAVLR